MTGGTITALADEELEACWCIRPSTPADTTRCAGQPGGAATDVRFRLPLAASLLSPPGFTLAVSLAVRRPGPGHRGHWLSLADAGPPAA